MVDRRTTIASFVAAIVGLSSARVQATPSERITVRPSKIEDVPAMVDMIERRRLRYQTYKPVFWKKAANSAQASLSWFRQMIESGVVAFTAIEEGKVAGFVFANETREPPVVDPGGVTVTLDDYCVVRENRWQDVGLALFECREGSGPRPRVAADCGDQRREGHRKKRVPQGKWSLHRFDLVDDPAVAVARWPSHSLFEELKRQQ